ncbi:hypothetical protein BpHYR1_036203 [Brachionus plicatilis]|uniref:Uncharacterized protein n=1 Tax=Brachionus plicatilis TaxID=10195 RepID=A0A3M7RJV4_BRAPC|nr:hypothetical protein BpHYR1_036203 [Brachionus plicatilis]
MALLLSKKLKYFKLTYECYEPDECLSPFLNKRTTKVREALEHQSDSSLTEPIMHSNQSNPDSVQEKIDLNIHNSLMCQVKQNLTVSARN